MIFAIWHLEPQCYTRYRRFLRYRSLRYRKFLRYRIDNLRYHYRRISSLYQRWQKSFDIKDSSISKILWYRRFLDIKDKTFDIGSDIEDFWYRSGDCGVLRYHYISYSISKFCILGPILVSKIPDIKDLNLQYRRTGDGHIVPHIKDLPYRTLYWRSSILKVFTLYCISFKTIDIKDRTSIFYIEELNFDIKLLYTVQYWSFNFDIEGATSISKG